MKKRRRILAIFMIFILLLPNTNVAVLAAESDEDLFEGMIDISSDWQGSVFGNVGGQSRINQDNFGVTENADGTVTVKSANNSGEIDSKTEGIAYYFKGVPVDGDYHLTATATVDSWTSGNQVAFGIMLRNSVLENDHNANFTGDYVAVGSIRNEMRAFYKYTDQEYERPKDLQFNGTPTIGNQHNLSIQKTGSNYIISIDGETKEINDYSGEINYAGLFTARNTTVTFSDVQLKTGVKDAAMKLDNLIKKAKLISNNEKSYTERSFSALQKAIEVAEAAFDTTDKGDVDALHAALQGSIDGLETIEPEPEEPDPTPVEPEPSPGEGDESGDTNSLDGTDGMIGFATMNGGTTGGEGNPGTPAELVIPPNEITNITSDWNGTVFGDVGGQDKITKENFEITENNDDTVTLRSSGDRGKISGGSDGIAYYFKQVPTDANFEITATATVEAFVANNQVSFGIMLRDDIHAYLHGVEYGTGDYVAVGALDQKMKAFTRSEGAQSKIDVDDSITPPTSGGVYELSVKKSGNLVTVKIGDKVEIIEDFTGNINYAGLFTARNAKVEFSHVNLSIEGQVELGDWAFNVFGDNTNDERNPDPTLNEDGSITLAAAGGKISSSVDGISFYHKEVPSNANFEITTKATVHKFGANNQVSFGLMVRDEIGEHGSSGGHEANYVAVGALDQSIKGFYKHGTQTKLSPFDSNIPSAGNEYDLTIKKSGDTYVVSVNGEDSEPLSLKDLLTDDVFAGIYVARDTEVTFSNTEIKVDTRTVESLHVDSSNMKTAYLLGESLDVTDLTVTAEFSDESTQVLSENDYIVTGFNSSEVGPNTITINYNGVTVTIELEIIALTVTDLAIKYYPAKTAYYKGDVFDPQGLVTVATYNKGYKIADLTSDQFSFSIAGQALPEDGYVFDDAGKVIVTITSAETPEQTTTFEVSVSEADLTAVEVRRQPSKALYFIGDELNLAGMSVYATYSDQKEVRLTSEDYEVAGFDSSTAGEKKLTITHKGKTVTLTVTVKAKEVEGIEVTIYPKTTYDIGEAFDSSELVVSKVYDNSERDLLSDEAYSIDAVNFDNKKAGTYSIRIVPTDSNLAAINFNVTVREKAEPEWKQIRFGQSASVNNNYIEIEEDGVIKVVALDGGGKVTGDHDGITFYYTEIDAEADNFAISADIKVENYAKTPHDGQESFGIMARDVLGPANDSSVFASNIAAIGGFSGGTGEKNGTQLFARTGVVAPDGEGSQGIQKIMLDPEKPDAENTAENYRLTLTKTTSGFTGRINNGKEEMIYEPDILKVQDGKMYIGFYAARLATIEVSNIDFTVTDSATDAPKVLPPIEADSPELEVVSLDKTSKTDYTLMVKSNVNGTVTIKQGQDIIAENKVVEGGKIAEVDTTIGDNIDTNFSIVFLPNDTQYLTDYDKIVQNFTVTMKTYEDNSHIYVSPRGTVNGHGTKESPLDLDTAIEFVQEGQKIIVLEGHYLRNTKLEIKKYNDGTAESMKYLIADPAAKERPLLDFDKKSEGVVHSGNYWHIEGIDFARSAGNTKGYTVGGSHNTIENSRTFENGDTGLQISRTDIYEEDKSKWPSHNLILNSISFDNSDPSENNADGFAAKLTSGEGNIFRGTVAYNNIDDGWDLYTKVGTGAIGAVTIEDSIAFNNGTLSNGYEGTGDKNGFKLGGEGVHVPHVIKNSVAFGNGTYGFTSNSNPGVIAENNISINNGTNLGFTTYGGIATDFIIDGFVSIQSATGTNDSYPEGSKSDRNYMFNNGKTTNKSGLELPEEFTDDILESIETIFNYDDDGRILSVKGNEWDNLWGTYNEVIVPDEVPSISVTELERLIKDAKSKTNQDGLYTNSSFDTLQAAIKVAEAALNTIESEKDLNNAVTALRLAINGLKRESVTEGIVISRPIIVDGQATILSSEIEKLAQSGQFVIDMTEEDVSEIYFTSDQMKALIAKNAMIVIKKIGVKLTIPALHFNGEEEVTITVEKITLDAKEIPKGKKLIGDIYQFSIMQGDELVDEFGQNPVTLEFAVDESKVTDTSKLKVFYLNEETGEWIAIGGTYKDGFITASTTHFSIFAVMEVTKAAEEIDEELNQIPSKETGTTVDTDGNQEKVDGEKNQTPTISDKKGESLPKTATSMYTMLLIGAMLILVGAVALIAPKRRKLAQSTD